MKNVDVLAIVPARGQSKGIPRKNIRLLNGKPLINYTIEAAINSKKISKVILTTDDEEIRKEGFKFGIDVIKRPNELATDDSSLIDVIFHVFDYLASNENLEPKLVILLQPTSPLRTTGDIDTALELYESSSCDTVISVVECPKTPYKMLKIEERYLIPFISAEYMHTSRQNLPKVYCPNGAIYIASPQILRIWNTFHVKKSIPYFMPPERSLDIDKEIDFKIAEYFFSINPRKEFHSV